MAPWLPGGQPHLKTICHALNDMIIIERGKWGLSEILTLLQKIKSNCTVYYLSSLYEYRLINKFYSYIDLVISFQLQPTKNVVIFTLYSKVMG